MSQTQVSPGLRLASQFGFFEIVPFSSEVVPEPGRLRLG